METAAGIFGWPNYYLPFLVRAGHLKPLGPGLAGQSHSHRGKADSGNEQKAKG
jgi:hypothetical protein